MLGAVQHELGADDLDLAFSTKLLDLLVEAQGLPDLVEDSGDDEAVGLGDTDQLVEALRADVAGGESADAGGDVVGAGQGVDGVGEVGRLELVVGAGVAGDVQHARAEVDAVDLLGSELGQVDADEAGAAASVQDLDGGGDEVAFTVAGSEVLADGLGDEWRGLVLLAVNHIVVVGLGPVIIQLGHLLDVQLTIRTSQERVVTVDVLIRVSGGGGGGHDRIVAVGFVALDSLEVAWERDGALGCWCYGMEQMAFQKEMSLEGFVALGLSLKLMFRKQVKVMHLEGSHSVFNGEFIERRGGGWDGKKKDGDVSQSSHIYVHWDIQITDDTPLRPLTWRMRRGMQSRIA